MNLLDVFGIAEGIIASEHIRSLNINLQNLPDGIENIFIINFKGAAILTNLIKCDTYTIHNNLLYFSGNIENLKFIVKNSFGKINRYIRKYKLSIYLFQYRNIILVVSGNTDNTNFYFIKKDVPFISNLLIVMDNSLLLNDLKIISYVYVYYIEFIQNDRTDLKLPILVIFTADNL
jgi:hypothetical protein